MYTIITGVAIASIIAIFFHLDGRMAYQNKWTYHLNLLYIIPVSWIPGGIVSAFIAIALPGKMENVEQSRAKIVTIQDNQSSSGKFLLGSGVINGTMNYSFYYEAGAGEYKLAQIPYHDASVKYTDGEPFVQMFKLQPTEHGFDWGIDNGAGSYYSVINVPHGTIIENFTLDAK